MREPCSERNERRGVRAGVGVTPRVVITGAGVVSTLGDDLETFWGRCMTGRTMVTEIPGHWRDYFEPVSPVWAPLALPDYRARGFSRVETMQQDPVALLAAVAGGEALARARLSSTVTNARHNTVAIGGVGPGQGGVYLGTGIGGASTLLGMQAHQMLSAPAARSAERATCFEAFTFPERFNPFTVSMSMPNAPAAFLGIKFGLDGENDTACVACASGTVAIGRAYRAIRDGRVELALAGGSEYLDDHYGGIFRGFDSARTLARGELPPSAPRDALNRPFDAKRCGFLFSQGGAAMVVLESERRASARNAPVLAEIVAFAESFDSHSMMRIEPGGTHIESMLRRVTSDAGIALNDVDYVNAHGTGTELNDETEAEIIGRVLGNGPAVNASKSLLGHTIGASGAFETVITALTLERQETHGCKNLHEPIAPLSFVREARSLAAKHALTHSFAFGGHNAALVLRRYES